MTFSDVDQRFGFSPLRVFGFPSKGEFFLYLWNLSEDPKINNRKIVI